jgi:hypothetical protein
MAQAAELSKMNSSRVAALQLPYYFTTLTDSQFSSGLFIQHMRQSSRRIALQEPITISQNISSQQVYSYRKPQFSHHSSLPCE